MKFTKRTKISAVLVVGIFLTVGVLYIINPGALQTFGEESITSLWEKNTTERFVSGPVVGDIDGDSKSELVIGSMDGNVYAYNSEDGSVLWSTNIGVAVDKTPTLSDLNDDGNTDIIITAEDNSIITLNGNDGSVMWSLFRTNLDVTGYLSDSHESDYYTIDVNQEGASFEATLVCFGNDFDLYGNLGSPPTTSDYDWRGYASGDEELRVDDVSTGTWHIMVHQYSGEGDYHLTLDVIYPGDLEDTTYQYTGSLDGEDDTDFYQLDIPTDAVQMHCVLSCGTNDFDLYGKLGSNPTTDIYDWRGFASGPEDVIIEYPEAGTWHLMVHSYSGSGAYRLTITVSQIVDTAPVSSSIPTGQIAAFDINDDSFPEVISGTRNNRIEVFSGLDGSLLQILPLGLDPQGGIAIADLDDDSILDVVSAVGHQKIIATNINGNILWIYDIGDTIVGTPIIADVNKDDQLDVIALADTGRCTAIIGNTGERLWHSSDYLQTSSGISIGDIDRDGALEIIIGYENGNIAALQGQTGDKFWEYQASGPIRFETTIADIDGDRDLDVIGSSEANEIFAIDGKTGVEIWKIQTPSAISGAPVVSDLDNDFLVEIAITCQTGQIFAIDVNSSGHRVYWQGGSGIPSFSKTFSQPLLDEDLDTMSTYSENRLLSDPYNFDSDGDTLEDGYEYSNGLSPILVDSDFDELDDIDEITIHGTDPTKFDTDEDRLSDYQEIMVHMTDPQNADSDQDLLLDGDEILIYNSNPFSPDSDSDTIEDGPEVHQYGSHPMLVDSDYDGLSDREEITVYHTWANNSDSDSDGIGDFDEITIYDSDPTNPDSDMDGAMDGIEVNELGTDLLNPDSDGDSAPDGWEANFGFDPLDYDVPVQEMLLFNLPIFSIGIGAFVAAVVIIQIRKRDELDIDDSRQDFVTVDQDEPDIQQPEATVYHAEDGLEKPWLMDGKTSLLRDGDVHDFMQWLVHEERRIDELENMHEHRKALRLARLLLKYVHQEKALIETGGPRTYSDAVRRLEAKINHLLVRM